jgi:hypothetical protein
LEDTSHRIGCPHERRRALDRLSADRIVRFLKRAAEGVSLTDESEQNLVPLSGQLGQLDATGRQNEEVIRVISFTKEELTCSHTHKVREIRDPLQGASIDPLEEWNIAKRASVLGSLE